MELLGEISGGTSGGIHGGFSVGMLDHRLLEVADFIGNELLVLEPYLPVRTAWKSSSPHSNTG